jgi:replicative DNA helicase
MDAEHRTTPPLAASVADVIEGIDEQLRSGAAQEFRNIATGFRELDAAVGGGLKVGQLVLLGGHPGVGKTTLALQMARNMAASGQFACLYVCFEHEPDYMVQRLICMESVGRGDGLPGDGLRLRDIADMVNENAREGANSSPLGLRAVLSKDERGVRALERLGRYGQRLLIAKGSPTTTVDAIRAMVKQMRAPGGVAGGRPVVVFVDYLQKVATNISHNNEGARNSEQVEGLKEMALNDLVLVVSIVAADTEGVRARRLRLGHFLTSPAVVYEADIVMIMNEEYNILDQHHIAYNPHNAEQMRQNVVLSLEKNRAGSDLVDLEFRKQLQFCCFRPDARRVKESLI